MPAPPNTVTLFCPQSTRALEDQARPNQTTICAFAVNLAVWVTKQSPSELSELPVLNKHTNTHKLRADVQQTSRLSVVSELGGIMRKIKHITSITKLTPFFFLFKAPINHSAKAFLRTPALPVSVPRHSWVLNLGSLKIACQQPGLRGEKGREGERVRERKMRRGERRGEAGARGE